MKKCQGTCEEHIGEVQNVIVSSKKSKLKWEFDYCDVARDVARDVDRKNGFLVEINEGENKKAVCVTCSEVFSIEETYKCIGGYQCMKCAGI